MWFRKKTRAKIERYEILVPLSYNNTLPVEQHKIDETLTELGGIFKGYTVEPARLTGFWLDEEGDPYYDEAIRVRIDIPYSEENREHFQSYKCTLKKRFKQKYIWITVHCLELI